MSELGPQKSYFRKALTARSCSASQCPNEEGVAPRNLNHCGRAHGCGAADPPARARGPGGQRRLLALRSQPLRRGSLLPRPQCEGASAGRCRHESGSAGSRRHFR